MLHILWILIKFILILLGILLGLVLLALLLVLFCPVRYSARAVKESDSFKEIQAEAKVSWLFRAIGIRFFFKNGEKNLVITLFGISLDQIRNFFNSLKEWRKKRAGKRQERKQRLAAQKAEKHRTPKEEKEYNFSENQEAESKVSEESKTLEVAKSLEESKAPKEANVPEESKILEESKESKVLEEIKIEENKVLERPKISEGLGTGEQGTLESPGASENPRTSENPETPEKSDLFTRILDILNNILKLPGNLWKKITSFIRNIQNSFRHLKQTFSKIKNKLDWWKEFLGNEKTKAAVALVWRDAKGLIRHVLPTKVEGQVTFGCKDPAITGTALAVLGMTFPFHKNKVQVTPLFDGENQLTGNVSLKGRIYGIMFVKSAIEIYFNKNIKYVMNRWKHKED